MHSVAIPRRCSACTTFKPFQMAVGANRKIYQHAFGIWVCMNAIFLRCGHKYVIYTILHTQIYINFRLVFFLHPLLFVCFGSCYTMLFHTSLLLLICLACVNLSKFFMELHFRCSTKFTNLRSSTIYVSVFGDQNKRHLHAHSFNVDKIFDTHTIV